MNIGFDVDGVIAKSIFRLDKLLRYHEGAWNRLLLNPVGRFLYRKFRHADKDVKEVLHQLKVSGHRVIIATYALSGNEEAVMKWLGDRGVPFDEIIFPIREESILEFKVRAIQEGNCRYYVEDQPALARDIAFESPKTQVICYRKKEDLAILLQ